MIDLKRKIEALLFVADAPLSVERIKDVLDGEENVDAKTIRAACQTLRVEYDELDRAFELVEVANGFQFRTRPEFSETVIRLRKSNPLRLSRAALETLAIVAYKQPVLRAEIERIRGVDCGGVLKALMERGLVKIRGRENLPGRPLTYGTTRRFLEVFELKSLADLPSLEELSLEAGLDPALARLEEGREIAPGLFPDRPLPSDETIQAVTRSEATPAPSGGEAAPASDTSNHDQNDQIETAPTDPDDNRNAPEGSPESRPAGEAPEGSG